MLGVNVCVCCVLLYEFTPGSHVVAHEHGEGVIDIACQVDGDLFQDACIWIHGRFPQLLRVHFAQTFVSLGVYSVFLTAAIFLDEVLAFLFRIAVFAYLPFRTFVEGWVGYVCPASMISGM